MVPYLFPHCSISLLSLLGNAEAVHVLLQTGANIFSIDKEDRTVLYWAAMQDHKNVIDVRNLSYIHTLVKKPKNIHKEVYIPNFAFKFCKYVALLNYCMESKKKCN